MLAKPASAAMRYEGMAVKPVTKQGIRVIDHMGTFRILWFVAKRHKVGLLAFLAVVGFTYDNLLPFAAREVFHLLFG